MAQSDQVVQNNTFPVVRADINDNLEALYSQSSGVSAPTVTVAFQPWVDTSVSPPLWKVRNAANTGWITVGVLDANFQVGGITPIANGGTGETTATAAINALVPSQTGNAGKFLGTNGSVLSWLTAAGGASVQVFSSSGTFTPTANKVSFLVLATGGGGGGGGSSNTSTAAGGGGGGGTALRVYNSTEMGASASVTVGGGGSGGNPNNGNGSTGGASVFAPAGTGVSITGYGGSGGIGGNGDGGGGGGSGNSLINIVGEFGCKATVTKRRTAIPTSTFDAAGGGAGGMSFWGYGTGSGANGAVWTGAHSGASGIVLILEW
jgi:hypothetical protein